MGWLGEYFQGEWVPIPVTCVNSSGAIANPSAAPTLSIYKANDTPVVDDVTMPPFAEGERTGFFQRDVQLNSSFSAGRYNCVIEYSVGGSAKIETHSFRVMAGGNAKGAYVALWYYPRPHANYIVGQLDDGTLEMRRGPKL